MMKIKNYVRYLSFLILSLGMNIYAQIPSLGEMFSRAQQEISGFFPPTNSSFTNSTVGFINQGLIKTMVNKLGHYFFDYAIPFLFVFGVLIYLAHKSGKEINRPLLLIFLIISGLTTIYLHDVLNLIALAFGFILLIIGLHKIFHGITGSIIGLLVTLLVLYGMLTNNSIREFISSSSFYVLLFVLFVIILIYSIKISQSSDTKKLKKLIYHIRKPEDVKKFENDVTNIVNHFKNSVNQKKKEFKTLVGTLQNNYLQQQQRPRQIKGLIDLLEKIRDNVKDFHDEYRNYIEDFNHDEAHINSHYNEPIRSYLIKILEEKGKREIKNIVKSEYQEYLQTYRQYLRSNRQKIINMAIKRYNKRRIDRIFNEIESLLHSFWI